MQFRMDVSQDVDKIYRVYYVTVSLIKSKWAEYIHFAKMLK